MRKKPYTNSELFDEIVKRIKEKGAYPDILDYALDSSHKSKSIEIKNYQFESVFMLNHGASEGIYLDCGIDGIIDDSFDEVKISLGTFKTLERSDEAMHIMGKLAADFTLELTKLIRENMADFTWSGYDVELYDEKGAKLFYGFSCKTEKDALLRGQEHHDKHPGHKVIIIDNYTKKTKTQFSGKVEL